MLYSGCQHHNYTVENRVRLQVDQKRPSVAARVRCDLYRPEEMKQFIPEVLGTLTGCKYFKPVVNLKLFDIFLK
jgi:hypothetical protein